MELKYNDIIKRGFITKCEGELLNSNYLRKVNLIDDDGDTEGIWVNLLTKDNTDIYDGTTHGDFFYGVLQNHALCFAPQGSWGMVIKCITQGDARAISYVKLPDKNKLSKYQAEFVCTN